jgi:hypothetical protein
MGSNELTGEISRYSGRESVWLAETRTTWSSVS